MRPFDTEIFYGERVGGARLERGGQVALPAAARPASRCAHTGAWRLGARVVPGLFAQTHAHPELDDRTLVDLLWHGEPATTGGRSGRAMAALRRYGLHQQGDQTFGTLSGGQQARFQILLLELSGRDLAAARRADRQPRRALAPRRWRRRWRPSTAPWSRSPTTAGSPDRSTGSWCSAPTARCTNRTSGTHVCQVYITRCSVTRRGLTPCCHDARSAPPRPPRPTHTPTATARSDLGHRTHHHPPLLPTLSSTTFSLSVFPPVAPPPHHRPFFFFF